MKRQRQRMSPARATRKLESIQAALGVSTDAELVRLVEQGNLRDAYVLWQQLENKRESLMLADDWQPTRELGKARTNLGHLRRFIQDASPSVHPAS